MGLRSFRKIPNGCIQFLLFSFELLFLLLQNYFVFCLIRLDHKVEFLLEHADFIFYCIFYIGSLFVQFLVKLKDFFVKFFVLLMYVLKLQLLFLNKKLLFFQNSFFFLDFDGKLINSGLFLFKLTLQVLYALLEL